MTHLIVHPARQFGRRAALATAFHPSDLTALGLVIERLEALEAGPELEADIFRALGWRAEATMSDPRASRATRATWRVRSPFALAWIAMPPVTRVTDGTAILVPHGWDFGCGIRRGHGFGWVARDQATFFEATGGTPAQCLARAALHGQRRILMESDHG